MASNRVLLHVTQLKLGMFVAELDRPWLGTSFLFQGFRIQNVEEIERLSQTCQYVYVDIEKCIDYHKLDARKPLKRLITNRHTYKLAASFEEEIHSANEIRESTRVTVDQLFDDVAHGRMIDLVSVKRLMHDTVDGVLRNPDAHVCLTQLKQRDAYTAQHSINVCVLSLALARHMGLSRSEMEILGVAALLHDIGKIKTPLDVLNKPDKLTPDEFAIMQQHPLTGRQLLEHHYALPYQIADVAFSHHERISGKGYPRGLKSSEISLFSKMVAIVDVYDAISSDRCYHDGISPTEALTKMYSWRLTDFDGELLEQFIQCVGIYPVGTLVELTSGEVGIVISVNPDFRLKPKVNIVLDSHKRPVYPHRVVDLAQHQLTAPDAPCAIRQVLAPDAYGIDIKAELAPFQQAKAKQRVS
jgi:putative nucleotidyltransferase with HDIG domain